MMASRAKATLMTATALVSGMVFAAPKAMAQSAPVATSSESQNYVISAQDLTIALRKYAEKSGLQLVYDSKIALGKTSSAVSGSMTAQDALGALLAGSGLSATFSGNGTVIINATGATAIPSLGVVRVEGAGGNGQASAVNGINGSRDAEATEATGSYTTGAISIGTKDAHSIKDTPASITVLTAQNIADQNISSLKDALTQMSGVTTTQSVGNDDSRRGAGFDQVQFFSRGFEITNIQIDGGAPITTGGTFLTGSNFYTPVIDLSEYDSIQLLRGADGLFNGYGDPGGTINLVRKKPLDHNQVTLDGQYGTYHDYRGVVDITGPIAFDGHVRARLIGTYEDKDYYYKVAHSTKNLFYGIVEADVTPTTLIDVGVDYTHQFGIPEASGLPRFLNGDSARLPVATCLCFPWNHSDFKTTNLFVDVDQKIGKDWGLKVKATRVIQTVDSKYGYAYGAINPATGAGPEVYADRFSPRTHEWAVDGTLNGAFMLFGQRQEILVGANYQYSDSGGTVGYNEIDLGQLNVFTFNPYDPLNPVNNAPADRINASRFNSFGSTQWGAYANIRFTPFKGLHLISGIRYTDFNAKYNIQNGICDAVSFFCPTIGQITTLYKLIGQSSVLTGVNRDHNLAKPNISAIYDVTKNLSAYGTYARIYQPQQNLVTSDGKTLPPVTGRNLEGGLKWQAPGGAMNATLALYSTIKDGVGLLIGKANITAFPGNNCCYTLGGATRYTSKGVDLDIAGRPAPGLQISGGYTFNENKTTGTGNFVYDDQPIVTLSPKHLLKFFATYNLRGSDWDRRFTFGGGVNYQSSAYTKGQNRLYTADPITGLQTVPVAGPVTYFNYTIEPNAIVQLRMAFKISEKSEVSLNVNNVMNAVTYQTTNSPSGGNYYVEPRTLTLAFHAKL